MMTEDLQVGEVVRLKSGGPLMTIDHIGPQNMGGKTNAALCSWFETIKGKQTRKTDWFELTSLVKVGPEAESSFYPERSIMG